MHSANLYILTRVRNKKLYTDYENTLSGRSHRTAVKPHEFQNLASLVELLLENSIGIRELDGFYYGYTIAQIGKEFDLLKLRPGHSTLNIELKSQAVPMDRIEKQLLKNRYYLSSVSPRLRLFTYVETTHSLYTLDNNHLALSGPGALVQVLKSFRKYETGDIDKYFRAGNYLISPLNEPERFAEGRYFLTQQQEMIKKEILSGDTPFCGITGDAGTGKTLLLYDLAACLAYGERKKCCLIHVGKLTDGHRKLMKAMLRSGLRAGFRDGLRSRSGRPGDVPSNVPADISAVRTSHGSDPFTRGNRPLIAFDMLEGRCLTSGQLSDYDCFFIDEAQRISVGDLEIIIDATVKNRGQCVFSYDKFQTLSKTEQRMDIQGRLAVLDGYREYNLSGRIRSNREISSFIRTLLDLGSAAHHTTGHEKAEVLFAADEKEAGRIVRYYSRNKGFVYISPEHSDREKLFMGLCRRSYYIEDVIGQEFDNVIIVIDDKFYYDEDGRLKGRGHPNPDYLYDRIFFQAVSRTRERLCLVVLGNEDVFARLLSVRGRTPG